MSREFKPGDVALVEAGCWSNRKVALRLAEGWAHTNGVNVDGDGVIEAVRPLVVIDPEDRGAVERLDTLIDAGLSGKDSPKWAGPADILQAALRQFANPTPPKPDEPLGRAATVEASCGCNPDLTRVFVRDEHAWGARSPWQARCGSHEWSKLTAVRILSEGVQP